MSEYENDLRKGLRVVRSEGLEADPVPAGGHGAPGVGEFEDGSDERSGLTRAADFLREVADRMEASDLPEDDVGVVVLFASKPESEDQFWAFQQETANLSPAEYSHVLSFLSYAHRVNEFGALVDSIEEVPW